VHYDPETSLKAGTGSHGAAARRLAAATAVALAVAVAVALLESDSQARSLGVQTPSVTVVAPGASVNVPSLGVALPATPVGPPQVTLPPVQVKPPPAPVKLPSVQVKPPPAPVKLPSPPVKSPAPPVKLPSPSVKSPALPVKSPAAAPGKGSLPAASPTSPGSALSRSATGATPAPSGSAASPLSEAIPGMTRLPSRSELAKLPPAQRRKLLRLAFDSPLRKQRLQQLRRVIGEHRGCLGALPDRGRRALELRAGLFGEEPASRRAIARRLGTSPSGALRLERTSLRRLVSADQRGLCAGGGAAATALGGLAGGSDGSTATPSSPGGGGGSDAPTGQVLADVHAGGPGIDLDDGEVGAAETLLFFLLTLLALLGPLVAIATVSRRRAGDRAATPAAAGERPLLFLDVDGVIALDPAAGDLPAGRLRASPFGLSYVPDRAGALVRELATRFDIVWATGWEQRANAELSSPLGLREELPVLTFGKKARSGTSTWKIKGVADYAGNRPAAWLDDNFVGRHERWAAHRAEPTLLVRVDHRAGLAPEHVARLLRWADRLAPSHAGRKPDRQRRLRAS
jgi:hypothetical protein